MGLYFLKCEMHACRTDGGPNGCELCRKVLCPRHAIKDGDLYFCRDCAPTPVLAPAQVDLFPRVRPRSKRSALDGLQRQ